MSKKQEFDVKSSLVSKQYPGNYLKRTIKFYYSADVFINLFGKFNYEDQKGELVLEQKCVKNVELFINQAYRNY